MVTANRTEEEGPLRAFVDELRAADPPVARVAAAPASSSTPRGETTPLALRANVEHNHVLHESVVIVSIETLRVPHVPPDDVVTIDDLGYGDDGISHVTARLGFQDETDVPRIVRMAARKGLERDVNVDSASFFLSRMTIVRTDAPGMAAVAQEALHGDGAQRERSRDVLRAARRPHGRHGLARQVLTARPPAPVGSRSGPHLPTSRRRRAPRPGRSAPVGSRHAR